MADAIKVNPTPIQRNILDVATELTQLYYKASSPANVEEIQETYSKFYAIALTMQATHYPKDVEKLLPDELLKKISK